MGDSEWCEGCDALPCACYCRLCGARTDAGYCNECDPDRYGKEEGEEGEEEEELIEGSCPNGGGCDRASCWDEDCPPDIAKLSPIDPDVLRSNPYVKLSPRLSPFEREKAIDKAIGPDAPDIPAAIAAECDALRALLLSKNKTYGNSAFEPIGVFADSDALALIATRADDKLSRIKNMGGLVHCLRNDTGEDAVQDLLGYLILARIAAKKQSK